MSSIKRPYIYIKKGDDHTMNGQFKKVLLVVCAMSLMFSATAWAAPNERYTLTESELVDSVLLPETVKSAIGKEVETERSKALATALCNIVNKENGVLGVYAETAMFIPVDWAALTIYLEKWNEDTNKWSTVETFEKEFTPADAENGELTHVILSIDVGTQPAGHYYRLRCIHELEYDNGWYEAKSTKTDGIMLTNIK